MATPTCRWPSGGGRPSKSWRSSRRKGSPIAPVTIEGRKIAKSFWGKSWCTNLERYSDYANRLPRGRTYVRNGSVVDLQIAKGEVVGAGERLRALQDQDRASRRSKRAAGKPSAATARASIDSLVELLQGRLAKGVMDRVCREGDGLFPAPRRDQAVLQLPGLGRHVQARRGGALRRRRPARRAAGAAVRAARRRREGVDRQRRRGCVVAKACPPRRRCSTTAMSPPCSDWRWRNRPSPRKHRSEPSRRRKRARRRKARDP